MTKNNTEPSEQKYEEYCVTFDYKRVIRICSWMLQMNFCVWQRCMQTAVEEQNGLWTEKAAR